MLGTGLGDRACEWEGCWGNAVEILSNVALLNQLMTSCHNLAGAPDFFDLCWDLLQPWEGTVVA